MSNTSLVFRIKLPKVEVEQHLLQILKLENLINGNEEKFFTEMSSKGKNFLMEFVVPMKEVGEDYQINEPK